jgi:hypothetical protein
VLRDISNKRIIQILLCHEADRDLIQNRLKYKEAHSEQKDESADTYSYLYDLLSKEISA